MKVRKIIRGTLAGALVFTECYSVINGLPVSEGFHALTLVAVMFFFKKDEDTDE